MLHPEFPLTLAVILEDYLLGGALGTLEIHLRYPNFGKYALDNVSGTGMSWPGVNVRSIS